MKFLIADHTPNAYVIISATSLLWVSSLSIPDTDSGILTPYTKRHGSGLSYEEISRCQPVIFKDVPHELYTRSVSNGTIPFAVDTKPFVKEIRRDLTRPSVLVRGHYILVKNPAKSVSVLEPKKAGGCDLKLTETVRVSSKQNHHCMIAVNAGLFHLKTGECLGNIVSDGRKVRDSKGIQNAHFGIKKDGSLFTGYLPEEEVKNGAFEQLVGGVVWLVRNGKSFVNESMLMECESTEETGSMERFVNILSARTAIGHDAAGNVLLLHVDGKSGIDGMNLWEMALFLIEMGAVNAINMDGGGSATFFINGTLVNYPSDECHTEGAFHCERKVSTIICVHPTLSNCSVHNDGQTGRENDCSGKERCLGSNCNQTSDLIITENQFFNATNGPCRAWAIACIAITSIATVSLLVNCAMCCFSARSLGLCAKTRRQRSAYKTVNLGELLVTSSDEETETILHHK